MTSVGGAVVETVTHWTDFKMNVKTYLKFNGGDIDCSNFKSPKAKKGGNGWAAYLKYIDCLTPPDMFPNEIESVDCGGCIISIKHSAL